VDDTNNWKPDPFGTHELRFFSSDGRPTLLVLDGGKRSYDRPPADQSERPLPTGHANLDPAMPEPQGTAVAYVPSTASADPTADHTLHSNPPEVGLNDVSIPVVGPTNDATERRSLLAEPISPSEESLKTSGDPRLSGAGYNEPEAMSRPLKIAYCIVLGVLALSVLGLGYVHLLHHSDDGKSTGAVPPTTSAHVTTTSVHEPTTTSALPTTLSASSEAAASALVSSWSTNNRSAALAVATSTAVATLFSTAYPSGLAIDRGCSTSFSPIVCTYGPPGGASPTDPIYQILVSQVQGGWYVSSVKIEN
jgi:hypothetical protein